MKKFFAFILLASFLSINAQQSANRFFYELTFKPKKDSARVDKVMSVLDITKDKSLFRDYTAIAQDSLLKAKVEEMQRTKVFQDLSKEVKMPKFSFKVTKKYPEMQIEYSEGILNGMTPVQLSYKETPKFDWKMLPGKEKIGEYQTQKATTEFGGRKWTAWFSTDIPLQDGPYKFYGLPGLIVKVEDADKNYSWELKGNKKIENFDELTYMEKMRPGGAGSVVEVSREKFEKTFNDYKQDPFSSIKTQMTPEMMSQTIPGAGKTIGEMVKEQEKMLKTFYGSNDNPVELPTPAKAKK